MLIRGYIFGLKATSAQAASLNTNVLLKHTQNVSISCFSKYMFEFVLVINSPVFFQQ